MTLAAAAAAAVVVAAVVVVCYCGSSVLSQPSSVVDEVVEDCTSHCCPDLVEANDCERNETQAGLDRSLEFDSREGYGQVYDSRDCMIGNPLTIPTHNDHPL